MSWSQSKEMRLDAPLDTQIDELLEACQPHITAEAAGATKQALLFLIPATARAQDGVRVSVSGHANEDKAPVAGWSNGHIGINVYQDPAAD
jgi:hypothetical protein